MTRGLRNITHIMIVMTLLVIMCTLLATPVLSADVQISWAANSESDLAGYRLYYAQPGDTGWSVGDGQASYTLGTLPNSVTLGRVTEYTLSDVAAGPYAVAITAIDTSGNESPFSSPVVALVPEAQQVIVVPLINLPPAAPVQIIINLVQ